MQDHMPDKLIARLSPEEIELANKLAELELLETTLAQKELELATLNGEVTAFNSRYLRSVGRLFSELDEIECEVAESRVGLNPQDPSAVNGATQARQRARESARAVNEARQVAEEFKPTDELKQLYREAARRFHPDRALDDENRARRNEIMAKINVAYQNNDLAALQRLLEEAGHLPDEIKGENVAAKLIRAIRRIAQINKRMVALDAEISGIKSSDIYTLKLKVENEEAAGGNPMGDLARHVTQKIIMARQALAAMHAVQRRKP